MEKGGGEERGETLKLGTWNLKGIYEEGALSNLIREVRKYKLDLIALQETHLKGSEVADVENYTLFTSGIQTRRYGTGFLIEWGMRSRIKQFQPKDDRLCSIRIKGEHNMITIVNIHAPTEEKIEDEKDQYYEELTAVVESIPRQAIIIIILGDANANVGREDIYRGVTGGESKHKDSNENGLKLISWAIERNLRIMSTHFKRKNVHKGTWKIRGSTETSQIDHVLIDERHTAFITNVRTCRGADADSDHFLVKVNLKLRKRERIKLKEHNRKEYNFAALKK